MSNVAQKTTVKVTFVIHIVLLISFLRESVLHIAAYFIKKSNRCQIRLKEKMARFLRGILFPFLIFRRNIDKISLLNPCQNRDFLLKGFYHVKETPT